MKEYDEEDENENEDENEILTGVNNILDKMHNDLEKLVDDLEKVSTEQLTEVNNKYYNKHNYSPSDRGATDLLKSLLKRVKYSKEYDEYKYYLDRLFKNAIDYIYMMRAEDQRKEFWDEE